MGLRRTPKPAVRRKRNCPIKKEGIEYIDYKDVEFLKQFISQGGRLLARRQTGLAKESHMKVENAIKRARSMGLLPLFVA